MLIGTVALIEVLLVVAGVSVVVSPISSPLLMRGLKKEDTPILRGYQIFHNYIREHEGLKGKTPGRSMWNNRRRKQQMADPNPKCV